MYNLDVVEKSHANGTLELDNQADSNSLSVHGYRENSKKAIKFKSKITLTNIDRCKELDRRNSSNSLQTR